MSVDNQVKFSKNRSSAAFMMLYKKGLAQLGEERDPRADNLNLDKEIERTEALTVDDTLEQFATENYELV